MLPGTFLYVYLGHVGRAGLEATAGGDQSRNLLEWAVTMIGLLATVALTVYCARLATRALRQTTNVSRLDETDPGAVSQPPPTGWPWVATILALVALAAIAAAIYCLLNLSG